LDFRGIIQISSFVILGVDSYRINAIVQSRSDGSTNEIGSPNIRIQGVTRNNQDRPRFESGSICELNRHKYDVPLMNEHYRLSQISSAGSLQISLKLA